MFARKQNRKKKNLANIRAVIPVAVAMLMLTIVGIGYVALSWRCEAIGREINSLETEKKELEKRLMNEEYKWMRMKSPCNIEEALSKHGIAMTWPRRDQVQRLSATALPASQLAVDGIVETRYASANSERMLIHE